MSRRPDLTPAQNERIRQRLQALRATMPTLATLARAIGMTQTVLSNFLHCRQNVSTKIATRIAAYLGEPLIDLLGGEVPAAPVVVYRQPTREMIRARRVHPTRAKTVSMVRFPLRKLRLLAQQYPEDPRPLRPKTRGDCEQGQRPCPFMSCRYHLFLDVSPTTGAIKMNFPDLDFDEIKDTCALDRADDGGLALEEVGEVMNCTRERIRQIETTALRRVREHGVLSAFTEGGDLGKRSLDTFSARKTAGDLTREEMRTGRPAGTAPPASIVTLDSRRPVAVPAESEVGQALVVEDSPDSDSEGVA